MNNLFCNNDSKNALDAQYEAQKIAFAPIIFQVAKSMRDLGILEYLNTHKNGSTVEEISKDLQISDYGVKTLLETSLSADIVKESDEKYFITKTGYFLLKDEMTRINMNYNHYVNYQGLFYLEESIKNEKAEGLKAFGEWDTIYPALSTLPDKAKKSWFEFDHFYSDSAFDDAAKIILNTDSKQILDIGGNTGKFTLTLCKHSKEVNITIMDLPEQIKLAKENFSSKTLKNQINFIENNILDTSTKIPTGFDIIWMSQFLDCFKEEDIVKILKKINDALTSDSYIYIMEPLWDMQKFETSSYCIINTSPYFTCMANGYSKMFSYKDLSSYIKKAGLTIKKEFHNIGLCQSILVCK